MKDLHLTRNTIVSDTTTYLNSDQLISDCVAIRLDSMGLHDRHTIKLRTKEVIQLRDWINAWLEEQKKLSDDNINILREVQRELAVVHDRLDKAIGSLKPKK